MDAIRLFTLLFLISPSLFATNLCDSSCELLISFPDGGSIEAIEPLTFTFSTGGHLILGETGTINTAIQPVSTDYSSAGTLKLAAGESITFDVNGSLNLGSGGNIEYTSISTQGPFTVDVTAVGGTESIKLDQLSITGEAIFNLDALIIKIDNIVSDSTVSITGSDKSSMFTTGSIEAPTLNLGAGNLIVEGNLSVGAIVPTVENLSNNITTNSSISLINSQSTEIAISNTNYCDLSLSSLCEPNLTFSAINNLNSGTITLSPSFYDDPTFLLDSAEFEIDDLSWFVNDQACTLSLIDEVMHCETVNGKTYKFTDGEWIEVDSSGFINILTLLLVSITLLVFRRVRKNNFLIKKG